MSSALRAHAGDEAQEEAGAEQGIGPEALGRRSTRWPYYRPPNRNDAKGIAAWGKALRSRIASENTDDFRRALLHCALAEQGHPAISKEAAPAAHAHRALMLLPDTSPVRIRLQWRLAFDALDAGRYPHAETAIRALLAWRQRSAPPMHHPEEHSAWNDWITFRRDRVRWLHAEWLTGTGRGEEAARMLMTEVAAARRQDPEAAHARGDLVMAARHAAIAQDRDLARQAIREAVVVAPEDPRLPYWELCLDLDSLSDDGHPTVSGAWIGEQARDRLLTFVREITRYPGGAPYTASAASIALGADRFAEALVLYEEALRDPSVRAWLAEHPQEREAFVGAVAIALRLGETDRAAALFVLLQGLHPRVLDSELILRQAFAQYEDFDARTKAAREAFEEARKRARAQAERAGLLDKEGRVLPSLTVPRHRATDAERLRADRRPDDTPPSDEAPVPLAVWILGGLVLLALLVGWARRP